MIELCNVHYRVDNHVLLSDVCVALGERRIAVIGANGSGKSTFARMLNGLLIPSTGEVLVDGINTRNNGAAVRKKVGFVFQNPDNQIVFPTVEEDLAFGLKNIGIDKSEIERRIDGILNHYGLGDFRKRMIHQLSGGEKQLIAVAGVLVMIPQAIVLDEPTTLLDLKNKQRMAEAIDALEQQVILVSHDLEMIAGFDRALCFSEGRIVCDDTPAHVIKHYRRLVM